MATFDLYHPELRDAIRPPLAEDIGTGDTTSGLTVAPRLRAHGTFVARQDLLLAGIELRPLIHAEQCGVAKVDLLGYTGALAADISFRSTMYAA